MGNVVNLNRKDTSEELSMKDYIDFIEKNDLKKVIICGVDDDGLPSVIASHLSVSECNLLLDIAKASVMQELFSE